MDKALTLEDYQSAVGSRFRVPFDDGTVVELTLEKAELNNNVTNDRQIGWALNFSGPGDKGLQQASYQMQHDTLGDLVLFIVPVAAEEGAFYYEAVFNLVRRE